MPVRVFLSMLLLGAFAPLPGCSEAAEELPSAEATEILTLGAIDDPVLGFSSVNDLAVGEHLHVLQTRRREVTELTRTGKLVRRVGRSGQGPGELVTPTGIGLRGDTLWIMDNGTSRVSYFLDGELVREEPFTAVQVLPGHNLAALLPLSGGALLAVLARRFEDPPGSPDNAFPLLRVHAGEPPDTLALLREASPFRGRIGHNEVAPIFPDFPLLTVGPRGGAFVVVDRPIPSGHLAEITVTKVSARGDTLYRTVIQRPAVPLPRETWDSAMDDQFERLPLSFTREEYEAALPPPRAFPPASRALLDAAGRVWLGLAVVPGSPTVEWVRLDALGSQEFRTGLPAGFRAYAATGTEVWGVVRGEYDEDYVRGYRIE